MVTYMQMLGIKITCNDTGTDGVQKDIMLTDEFGAVLHVIEDNKRAVKRRLEIWARRAILRALSERCCGEDEEGPISKGRKDVYDISPYVDRQATMASFSATKGKNLMPKTQS